MNPTNNTGRLCVLFIWLAAMRGYTEDEIVDLVSSVMDLPRSEQPRAYMRGIDALLRPAPQEVTV